MSEKPNPLQHPEVQQAKISNYGMAYLVTVCFMLAAYLLTHWHVLDYMGLLDAVSGLVLLSAIAQVFWFFGLDFSPEHFAKTVSLAMVVPLFVLSIGLTVWMFHTLYWRTMLPPGVTASTVGF